MENSSLCLLLLAVIMALLAALKLRGVSDPTALHRFDASATMPVRGILAILIVCLHIGHRYTDTPMSIFTSFGATLVSAFFFISGYGLMVSYRKKGKAYLDNFFTHRLSKLLPVCVILSLACIIYACLVEQKPFPELMGDWLRGYTLLPNSWFVYALIYQYIAFYLGCRISSNCLYSILITTFLTILFMAVMCIFNWGRYWWISQPAFILGMAVAYYEDCLRSMLVRHSWLTISAVWTVMFIGAIHVYFRIIPGCISIFLFPNFMPVLILFMVYAYGVIENKAIHYVGYISLEVYLIHGLIIKGIVPFGLPWYIFVVCVFTLTIAASAIAHQLVSRDARSGRPSAAWGIFKTFKKPPQNLQGNDPLSSRK